MCDIDGKTVSLHVRLCEQFHSKFALVVPREIYVCLLVVPIEISVILWFEPQVFLEKGDDPKNFVDPVFQGVICMI